MSLSSAASSERASAAKCRTLASGAFAGSAAGSFCSWRQRTWPTARRGTDERQVVDCRRVDVGKLLRERPALEPRVGRTLDRGHTTNPCPLPAGRHSNQ
jgi:hypothetical protein